MSMTPASKEYFENVAGQWDEIRSGYFTEAVREAATARAYLRPEMIVADVGAGTGFLAAGLAPLVKQVYVLDGSPAMLEVARKNLSGFGNVVFQQADGESLPLPDASLDAVFANMYLHHTPDPLAAIREMARLLKPGGRLVITDMDAHPYSWLKDEMTDVWQGFERPQVRAWFEQVDLVNVMVDNTGQCCQSESGNRLLTDSAGRTANISIFVAVGTKQEAERKKTMSSQTSSEDVRPYVREHYGKIAESFTPESTAGCCSPASSCGCNSESQLIQLYDIPDVKQLPSDVTGLSLGCGDPVTLAELLPGQTVLDLGSGGGIDCFLAARQVGQTGRVIGVDMTPAMLEKARLNKEKLNADNVEFRLGEIEHLPVADGTVDVIISNCVINLSPDKPQVMREAFRVLKPGGKLAVSDVVTNGPLPGAIKSSLSEWAGCVAGAPDRQDYIQFIQDAGFTDVQLTPVYLPREAIDEALDSMDESLRLEVATDENLYQAVFSARITARKPG